MKASSLLLLGSLPAAVLAADVIETDGFTTCGSNSDIQVTDMSLKFDKSTDIITFSFAGSNSVEQNVTAALTVTAYGSTVYTKTFNPCAAANYVEQLCPGKIMFANDEVQLANQLNSTLWHVHGVGFPYSSLLICRYDPLNRLLGP